MKKEARALRFLLFAADSGFVGQAIQNRMENVIAEDRVFQRRPVSTWHPLLQSGFGIFQDTETFPVTVRFSPRMARWVREQIWHPEQSMTEDTDGALTLSLPAADLREIKMKILQFGAEAEVLAPAALRDLTREDAKRLADIYGKRE